MTTEAATTPRIDEDRLNAIVGRAVDDFGAVISSALVVLGDKLGLYRTLDQVGPSSAAGLAAASGTSEAYVRPWLINQAAAGYVDYDPAGDTYSLSPEQAMVFTTEDTPASMAGGFEVVTAAIKAEQPIADLLRSGGGLPWASQDDGLFTGTARFFKPGYLGNLVQSWIPALDGVAEKLASGATVADVGCGHGASTIIMAQAYPKSRFFGFDSHAPSIEAARHAAAESGVSDRVSFEVASATEFPGSGYDLVALFDCLHDFGDPEGAAGRILTSLDANGSAMIVEPMAGDRVEENFNPIGRIYSAASVLICTPNAIADGGRVLGTIATEPELREVFIGAGFGSFRRATATPTNRIFEARR
jgi:SAM-dependent methyltransferase